MLLGSVMWDIFQKTGRIEAYLIYRTCSDESIRQGERRDEGQEEEPGYHAH